jgi:hypothetical protein
LLAFQAAGGAGAQSDKRFVDSAGAKQVPRCVRNEKDSHSQEFPAAAWLQSASSGSFDCVVTYAPASLKMTTGQRLFQFRRFWKWRQLGNLRNAGNLGNIGDADKFGHLRKSGNTGNCWQSWQLLSILAIRFGSFSLVATIDGSQAIMPILL